MKIPATANPTRLTIGMFWDGVKPEECLKVGNDVDEDMIAEQLGMKAFPRTDCMINKANADISVYPHGSFDDLKNFLNTL